MSSISSRFVCAGAHPGGLEGGGAGEAEVSVSPAGGAAGLLLRLRRDQRKNDRAATATTMITNTHSTGETGAPPGGDAAETTNVPDAVAQFPAASLAQTRYVYVPAVEIARVA